uniref:VWFA domain-containing protein n=1 Tax=Panagrolaimus sp. ES5 TaxID=591445 RepID=A0AC34FI53_9BILA
MRFIPNPHPPIIINTLIQVYVDGKNKTVGNPALEGRVVTGIQNNDRVILTKEFDVKTHKFIEENGRANSNQKNLIQVNAVADTNSTKIARDDLQKELEKELEHSIPLILDELDKVKINNKINVAKDTMMIDNLNTQKGKNKQGNEEEVSIEDLEKLIREGLNELEDSEAKKQLEKEFKEVVEATTTTSAEQFSTSYEPPTKSISTTTKVHFTTTQEPITVTTTTTTETDAIIIFTTPNAHESNMVIREMKPQIDENEDLEVEVSTLPPGVVTFVANIEPATETETESTLATEETTTKMTTPKAAILTPEMAEMMAPIKAMVIKSEESIEKEEEEERWRSTPEPPEMMAPEKAMIMESEEDMEIEKQTPIPAEMIMPVKAMIIKSAEELEASTHAPATPSTTTTITLPFASEQCEIPNDESEKLKGDVLFLLDSSTSIGNATFQKAVQLVKQIVLNFSNIGPKGVQFALIQYNREPWLEFTFRRHTCLSLLLDDIEDTEFMNGPSNLGRALNKVMKYAFTPARGDRPDVENIVVLVSDGLSEDKVQLPVTLSRQNGTTPIVVATLQAKKDILMDIAEKDQNNMFNLTEALHKPLGERLAQRIKEILKSNENFESPQATVVALTSTTPGKDISETDEPMGMMQQNEDFPKGINYSLVLNLLHNKEIVTARDKSFIIQCFRPTNVINSTLEAQLDVIGHLPITKTISLTVAPPKCHYSLRQDTHNGPIVQKARIGQPPVCPSFNSTTANDVLLTRRVRNYDGALQTALTSELSTTMVDVSDPLSAIRIHQLHLPIAIVIIIALILGSIMGIIWHFCQNKSPKKIFSRNGTSRASTFPDDESTTDKSETLSFRSLDFRTPEERSMDLSEVATTSPSSPE